MHQKQALLLQDFNCPRRMTVERAPLKTKGGKRASAMTPTSSKQTGSDCGTKGCQADCTNSCVADAIAPQTQAPSTTSTTADEQLTHDKHCHQRTQGINMTSIEKGEGNVIRGGLGGISEHGLHEQSRFEFLRPCSPAVPLQQFHVVCYDSLPTTTGVTRCYRMV